MLLVAAGQDGGPGGVDGHHDLGEVFKVRTSQFFFYFWTGFRI